MDSEPIIRILRGIPTAEELAALVGVLSLRRAARPARHAAGAGQWVCSGRPAGRGLRPGPGAWRASGLPAPRQP